MSGTPSRHGDLFAERSDVAPVFVRASDFDSWRKRSRQLLRLDAPPENVVWLSDDSQAAFAFGEPVSFVDSTESDRHSDASRPRSGVGSQDERNGQGELEERRHVPKSFLDLASSVACHRSSGRWSLLYRSLWRLTHGEANLLRRETDDDVLAMQRMEKAVRRDVHKMKAFVRFRRIERDGVEHFVAWHRPDHPIVRRVAPFFSRRFVGMRWSILTPDESVSWDGEALSYGPGVPRSNAPAPDELESLWLTYYRSIFNPARVKVRAMTREMPVRHWPTLPETELITELLRESGRRVEGMLDHREGPSTSAAEFLTDQAIATGITSPKQLAAAAKGCQACDLCRHATQVVFGEGPREASLMLVGEQPGDQEDRSGRPFVGPAGELLDQALASAAIDRRDVYVTNAVKHFKFQQRGKRRLHQKPNPREVEACRPWLEAEIDVVAPRVIVCLGATAATTILGRDFRITHQRGQWKRSDRGPHVLATWHPAAILRATAQDRHREMVEQFRSDLTEAWGRVRETAMPEPDQAVKRKGSTSDTKDTTA